MSLGIVNIIKGGIYNNCIFGIPLLVALRQRLLGRHHLKEETEPVSVRSVICVVLPLCYIFKQSLFL